VIEKGTFFTKRSLSLFNKKTVKIKPCSAMYHDIPGKNPGTSTKVTMGMLKASQKRTNLAPFTEALMSRQPENNMG